MNSGSICRVLSEYSADITIALRNNRFIINSTFAEELHIDHPHDNEIRSTLQSNPAAARQLHILNENNITKATEIYP